MLSSMTSRTPPPPASRRPPLLVTARAISGLPPPAARKAGLSSTARLPFQQRQRASPAPPQAQLAPSGGPTASTAAFTMAALGASPAAAGLQVLAGRVGAGAGAGAGGASATRGRGVLGLPGGAAAVGRGDGRSLRRLLGPLS
jgi:hypothetical protein